MQRPIWKGAISFGLVHVPVALYPAASESGVDFDWLGPAKSPKPPKAKEAKVPKPAPVRRSAARKRA